ncbi:MAG: hypothetical protein ACYDCJ_12990 [Gammaproteobacteria bacterium]
MRRFRCGGCLERGLISEWEHHHRESFCVECGKGGVEIVEWGCFECREEGLRFWEKKDEVPECPECGLPALRIMYAPMLTPSESRERHAFADKLLMKELENRGLTDITPATPRQNPFAARWAPVEEVAVIQRPGGSMELISQIPKTLTPLTHIAGRDDRKTL